MLTEPLSRPQIALMAAGLLFVILKVPLYGMRMSFLGYSMSLRRYLLIGWALSMSLLFITG